MSNRDYALLQGAKYMGFKFWETPGMPVSEAFVFLRKSQDYVDRRLGISTKLLFVVDEDRIIFVMGRPRKPVNKDALKP